METSYFLMSCFITLFYIFQSMSLPRLFQQARREASLEHYRRVGILDELGADVTLEENKKLERRLTAMMKKLKAQNEDIKTLQKK